MVSDFSADLARGQEHERKVAAIIGGVLGTAHRDHGDIVALTGAKLTNVEVKLDVRAAETGNLAFELADVFPAFTRLTGVLKLASFEQPTVVVHTIGDSKDALSLVVDPRTVVSMLLNTERHVRLVSVPNRGYHTVNWLVRTAELDCGLFVRPPELADTVLTWVPSQVVSRSKAELAAIYRDVVRRANKTADPSFLTEPVAPKVAA